MSFSKLWTKWMNGKSGRRAGLSSNVPCAACIETVESRTVPSMTSLFNAGALTITSNAADNMTVSANANGNVTLNGTQLTVHNAPVAANTVTSLDVVGGKGKNVIDLSGVT